jgi:hypothetical protein
VCIQSDDPVDFSIFENIPSVCVAFADGAGRLDAQGLLDALPASVLAAEQEHGTAQHRAAAVRDMQ